MLLIAGLVRIDPIHRDDLIQTAIEVVRELRKQIGCTYISVSADVEDPCVLHLVQRWESQEALFANLAAPHIAAIASRAGRIGVREMTLLKYDVEAVGPIRLVGARVEPEA
jgi:quinol monooxygenase YgiN